MDAKYIGKLCTKIGTEWHLLGICLGFTSVQMEHLRHAHPTNIYQCAFELISKWNSVLEQHNIETRPILADAFRDLKRTDLADELTICSPRLSDSLRIHRFNKQFSEDCWDELDGITLDSSDEKARRRKSTRYMDDLQAVKFVNAYTDPLYRVIEQSKITLDHKLKSMGGLIKTTAYEKAMKILQSTGLIIITGNAGDGKTSLAINILRKMKKEGYTVLILSDPGMLEQTIDPSRKIIYFVDDAFGTPTLSKNAVEIWVKLYDKIESFVSEEKMMMVLASRKLVLMKAKEMGMDKYCSKYPQSVIDLTDHSYCLTDTEKKRMVASHCEGVGLFPMQLLHNISTYSPGFPLMCKLYANNPRLRKNAQFFHNPTVVLQKDINDLLRNDPTAFCVLVLMVLYDGKLPVECLDIEEEDAIDEGKLEVVVNSYGLDRSSALVKMGKSISVLQGVYIEEHEDTYVFLHDSIFDSVCIAFGKKHPKEILKIVSSNFIAQRIRTENTVQAENEDDLDVIILKKSKLKYLAGRWIREITEGDIRHAINNPAFQDEAMTKTFIVEIGKLTFAAFERLVGSVENGKNFVEFLIDEGHTAIAEYLLQRIKDNSLIDFQLSPKSFHNAIGKRNFDIVKLMLDFGANPTITTRPLKINGVHMAAKTGDAQILQLMLEFCDAKTAESADSSGLLPIHYACQSSSLPCVELLVSKSSNYNCKDGDGKLPIHYAARAGSLECVKFLNDNGSPLHSTDFSGQTLLHLAALNGNVTLITYLLQNGCNPNITDVTSSTPLMYACQNGCSEAIPILIKCGANVNFHNRQRKYPIHMAAEGCHPDDNAARDCIQSLLLAGADPNVEDDQHKTALHYACAWSFDHRYDCVFVLIEAQSNINIPDASKMTPLMYACTSGSFNCATLLVMKGANPECEGSRRNKPIHLACANGNIEIVKLLQNKSVNIKATNEDGRQPIHFASQYGNEEVVCFLIWNGVDINATDNFGKTPLHYACKWGRGKTVKLLMQLEANPDVKDIENNLPCNLIPEWSMDSSIIRKFLSNSTNTF